MQIKTVFILTILLCLISIANAQNENQDTTK